MAFRAGKALSCAAAIADKNFGISFFRSSQSHFKSGPASFGPGWAF
jgi:hypothetical protein